VSFDKQPKTVNTKPSFL